MKIVTLQKLSKHYGTRNILDGIDLELNKNGKYGLIGPNGSGKTTLIRIIVGLEEADQGRCNTGREVRLGYVPQQFEIGEMKTVNEFLLEEHDRFQAELSGLEERIGTVNGQPLERLLASYQEKRDAFEAFGGSLIPDRCGKLLHASGLGLSGEEMLEGLSGGEKNMLSLLKAVMLKPDFLVLDEPGNHLDYKGLDWLERFLAEFNGGVLLVSHNRYLLDRVCTRILKLENGRIREYAGNYSEYRIADLKEAVSAQAYSATYQKKIDRVTELVSQFRERARNTADPAWGQRLKAMKKRLERVTENAPDKPELSLEKIRASFNSLSTRSDIALRIRGYSKSFGDRVLFKDADLEILTGEKVALLGPNGSGKTTLIRDIVACGNPDNPGMRIGPGFRVGYCAQLAETLNPESTIEEEFGLLGLTSDRTFALLSRFLFSWHDLGKKTGNLSGGEKNRLQLARLIHLASNFLILDEPTNHLDIPAKEAIEDAIAEFPGTVLVVSHDRYFLDRIAGRVVEISEGRLVSHAGNYSDYWEKNGRSVSRSTGKLTDRGKERRKVPKSRQETGSRTIELRIDGLEREKQELENLVLDAYEKKNHERGKSLSIKLSGTEKMLARLYREWEEAM
jgi:ATP-binding cassette, subfamily F, member 3